MTYLLVRTAPRTANRTGCQQSVHFVFRDKSAKKRNKKREIRPTAARLPGSANGHALDATPIVRRTSLCRNSLRLPGKRNFWPGDKGAERAVRNRVCPPETLALGEKPPIGAQIARCRENLLGLGVIGGAMRTRTTDPDGRATGSAVTGDVGSGASREQRLAAPNSPRPAADVLVEGPGGSYNHDLALSPLSLRFSAASIAKRTASDWLL